MDDLRAYFTAFPRDDSGDVCTCGHTRKRHSGDGVTGFGTLGCDVQLPLGVEPRPNAKYPYHADDCMEFVLAEKEVPTWTT